MFGGFYECSITLIDCCLSSQIRCKPWDINIIIKKETTRKPLGVPVSYLSIFEKYILNTRCVRQLDDNIISESEPHSPHLLSQAS